MVLGRNQDSSHWKSWYTALCLYLKTLCLIGSVASLAMNSFYAGSQTRGRLCVTRCSCLLSAAERNIMTRNNWERKGFYLVHPWEKPQQKCKTGTWREELKHWPWRNTAYCPVIMVCSACFLTYPRTTYPNRSWWSGISHGNYLIKKMPPPKKMPTGQSDEGIFSSESPSS